MLLSLRSLWETTAAAVAEVITGATRKHPKIQRKLRRLARWSEAVAPPRVNVTIQGEAFPPLRPGVATGTVVTTKHVAVYSKGALGPQLEVVPFLGVDVSIFAHSAVSVPHSIKSGETEAEIDLIRDEIMALAMLAA